MEQFRGTVSNNLEVVVQEFLEELAVVGTEVVESSGVCFVFGQEEQGVSHRRC